MQIKPESFAHAVAHAMEVFQTRTFVQTKFGFSATWQDIYCMQVCNHHKQARISTTDD